MTRSGLTAELLAPRDASRHALAWVELAEHALEPNAFFAPETALAGLAHLPEGRSGQVAMVWRDGRLVGVLPVVRPGWRYLVPLPVLRAGAFYGTLSTPLLDPEDPGTTIDALFGALARAGVQGLLLPYIHEDGPIDQAMAAHAAVRGLRRQRLSGHRRAFLDSDLPGADYARTTLETRRRKEVDRQRRRLADTGALTFTVARSPVEVAAAVETFLNLEATGWKSRAGTDMRTAPGAATFLRSASAGLAARGAIRVATLSLDGSAVAAGVVLTAGGRAYYAKTCYDEALSRFSPGFLLTLDLTAHLLDDPGIGSADSIAVADHPMIDRLWTGRFPIAAMLVETREAGAGYATAAAAENLREVVRRRSRPARLTIGQWIEALRKG